MENLAGVDVEELLVEAYAPKIAFGGGWAAASACGSEEGGLVGLDFGAATVGVGREVWVNMVSRCVHGWVYRNRTGVVEFEVVVQVSVA